MSVERAHPSRGLNAEPPAARQIHGASPLRIGTLQFTTAATSGLVIALFSSWSTASTSSGRANR